MDFIDGLRQAINQPFSLEIIVLVYWAIRSARNDFYFKGISPSIYRARATFKRELGLLIHKAKQKKYSGMTLWVNNFV
jgi:hypothetical protein